MASVLYAVIGPVGIFLLALFLSAAENWPPIFHQYVRMALREYAAAISIVFFIGIPYMGELARLNKDTLYTSKDGFRPNSPGREHLYVRFWELPAEWAAAAMIPGAIITMLFFFDHEISSIICTIKRYGYRSPGLDTLCGILGIPPANEFLPQAPLRSESLIHDVRGDYMDQEVVDKHGVERLVQVPVLGVYEQRWSHFLHAAAILVFIAPTLQHVLGLTPTYVLTGLFIFMGQQSLSVNPILQRTFWIHTPANKIPPLPQGIRNWWAVHSYTLFEIKMAMVVFIVSQTVAGRAFPVIIVALVPFRLLVMHKIWSKDVLTYEDRRACRAGWPEDERADGSIGSAVQARDEEVEVGGRDVEKGPVEYETVSASSTVDEAAGALDLKR